MESARVKVPLSAVALVALLQIQSLAFVGAVQKCGSGVKCLSSNLCCSADGYCGTSSYYCGSGCQSGPCYDRKSFGFGAATEADESSQGIAQMVTAEMFDSIFPARDQFYTYQAFVEASGEFSGFGSTGSSTAQMRDVAAFLAHIHQETEGLTIVAAADTSADFCLKSERVKSCKCAPGKKYFARGPMQLTWNYNYGAASDAVGADLLAQPELLSKDAVFSFKSAIWVWMSSPSDADATKTPSGHEVMAGSWAPSADDLAANRTAGFGASIDVLKGPEECGHPSTAAEARKQKYLQITTAMNVSAGPNLDCATMLPF